MGTDSPRSHQSPVTLGALVLLLCALVAATFDGPRWTAAEQGDDRPPVSRHDGRGDRADDQAAQESPSEDDGDTDRWLPWVPPADLLLLVPAALVLGLALVVVARLRVTRRRRQLTGRSGLRRTPVPVAEPPPEDEVSLPEALDASARMLGEGSPRNAIVAAWVRLEQAVEGEHFPHRPEETPSELVERVVSSYHLDGEAIGQLASLYREARFSVHPVTEEHRAEAADCLRRLLTSLRTASR